MSYFTGQTRIVELDDENRVVIKRLTYGERQAVIDASTSVDANMTPVVHVGAGKRAMLLAAVVSWEGPGFEGRPVTPENIDALPPEIADRIASQIDALQAGLTGDEKKASTGR